MLFGLASYAGLVETQAVLSEGFFLEEKRDTSQKVLGSAPLSEQPLMCGFHSQSVGCTRVGQSRAGPLRQAQGDSLLCPLWV